MGTERLPPALPRQPRLSASATVPGSGASGCRSLASIPPGGGAGGSRGTSAGRALSGFLRMRCLGKHRGGVAKSPGLGVVLPVFESQSSGSDCVISSQSVHLLDPQFPHLRSGGNKNTCSVGRWEE